VLIPQTGPVTERLRADEIGDDERRRLVRIVRRGTDSVATWRRTQMVLLSAQVMDGGTKVAFTSEDRVLDRSLPYQVCSGNAGTGSNPGHRACACLLSARR
jgi:hypothetical protein